MALLLTLSHSSFLTPLSPSIPATISSITAIHSLRVHNRLVKPSLLNGLQSHATILLERRTYVIVKASEMDSTSSDGDIPPPETKEEVVPVENLPLESKAKLRQEQQLKMKLAKKIRLRRKRLVRKRHLRKKGRWPPSKMKKNKNV